MLLAVGAARPEAPDAKEPCQRGVPTYNTRSGARMLCVGEHSIRGARVANWVFGLARVLAEGGGGRPFFLLSPLRLRFQWVLFSLRFFVWYPDTFEKFDSIE
jgi:hypothetical protein